MEAPAKDLIAERWGVAPDDAINFATIPAVEARSRALARRILRGVPWASPYRTGHDEQAGTFSLILDAIHAPGHPIRRLLSLCCGHGHAERAFAHARTVRSFDGLDISQAALNQAEALAQAAGLQGINYAVHDINQLALKGTYDFAFAGGLHHIQALEHVCAEVRAHLEPGAPFLMYEYIGEARGQYSTRQVEAINACIRLLPERLRVRVSSQRELGVGSAGEAYDRIRRRHASLRMARPIGTDVFPMGRIKCHKGATIEPQAQGVRVITSSQRWEYAASLRAAVPIAKELRDADLVVVIDAQVQEGEIGIGCLARDRSTYLQEETVIAAGPRGTWRIPLTRPAECDTIVLRNASPIGRSTVDLARVTLAAADTSAVPGKEDDAIAHDLLMRRHFWNEFTPMTVEQWLATDPSESVRSNEIIPVLRATFPWVDVHYMRCSLLQFVLYDLASNFYGDNEEVRHYLDLLFHIEDVVMTHDDIPENFAYIVASDRDLTRQNSV